MPSQLLNAVECLDGFGEICTEKTKPACLCLQEKKIVQHEDYQKLILFYFGINLP